MNQGKIWRKVTYPRITRNMYIVSENGEVYNCILNKMMSPYFDKDGYLRISLCAKNTNSKNHIQVRINRLVAWEFCQNRDISLVVDHIDGVKTNNHFSNLEWVTVKENTHRAEKLGLRKVQGAYNGNSKYTENEVIEICEKYEDGLMPKDLFIEKYGENARVYDSSETHGYYTLLYNLRYKKAWKYIVNDYNFTPGLMNTRYTHKPIPETSNFKYSEEIIRYICKSLSNGKSYKYLALELSKADNTNSKEYNRWYSLCMQIGHRKNWTHISKDYIFPKYVGYDKPHLISRLTVDMLNEGYEKDDISNILKIKYQLNLDHNDVKTIKRVSKKYNKFSMIPENTNINI